MQKHGWLDDEDTWKGKRLSAAEKMLLWSENQKAVWSEKYENATWRKAEHYLLGIAAWSRCEDCQGDDVTPFYEMAVYDYVLFELMMLIALGDLFNICITIQLKLKPEIMKIRKIGMLERG